MRLFAPSYQIPGSWAENCEYMAAAPGYRDVSGVELLFFRYDDEDSILLAAEWERIRALQHRFSFSLHLPDPLEERHAVLFDLTADLVEGAVMHLPAENRDEALVLREEFEQCYNVPIQIENTPAVSAAEIDHGLPFCLDCGHALLAGESPPRIASEGRHLAAVHLHGVVARRDHAPLSMDDEWLRQLLPLLDAPGLRTVVEVFSEAEMLESLQVIRALRKQIR